MVTYLYILYDTLSKLDPIKDQLSKYFHTCQSIAKVTRLAVHFLSMRLSSIISVIMETADVW